MTDTCYLVHGVLWMDRRPFSAHAVRGSQCEPCQLADDTRLIHDFHREGAVITR